MGKQFDNIFILPIFFCVILFDLIYTRHLFNLKFYFVAGKIKVGINGIFNFPAFFFLV